MRFDIITIFPELLSSIFEHGVLRRARQNGLVTIAVHDLRAFTHDRHRTVDDRPFGGGEGMVLKPEPLAAAIESLELAQKEYRAEAKQSVVLLSAQGAQFTQTTARELASLERVVFLCGRYEGVDERVNELFCDRELSIGDYVLSGGELAAAVVLDATMRLLPGVLGNEASSTFESFGAPDAEMDGPGAGSPPRATHGAGGSVGLSALHAAGRVSRTPCARCAERGQSRRDPGLAKAAGDREDAAQPAGPAGARAAQPG